MHLLIAALLGIILAFIGSIPVAGPLAVLVVDRSVSGRRAEGLFIAFGGALAKEGFHSLSSLTTIVPAARSPNLLVRLLNTATMPPRT